MKARAAWLWLGLAPLLVTSAGIAWMLNQRARVLADLHLQAVEPVLLAARRAELQGKLNVGRSSIAHLVRDGMPEREAQRQALTILRRLEFGHDGFFFVFSFDGQVLLDPREPELEGRNLLTQPATGRRIEPLLAQARAGGGYVQLPWRRPSSGQLEPQLVYVEPIAGWEWMLGTGAFIDELEAARTRMQQATEAALVDTLGRLAALALLGLLTLAAGALFVNVSEQRKADARLRQLAAQLVRSQEDERARVARELHDGVTQSLVSVKFLAESAAAAQPSPQLEAVVTRLREVLGEVRLIAHDLRPPLLDDLGLARALEQLGREWQARSGVALHMELVELPRLPETVATALFRFAQEALGNVERHAIANHVRLVMQVDGAGLLLGIEDDGIGFDVVAARQGLGLLHLRERIENLGGQLQLESRAGHTRVAAYLPRTAWT